MFPREDAGLLLPGGRAERLHRDSLAEAPAPPTQRLALTFRPRLGCADSDLRGRDLQDLRPKLGLRRVSAPLPQRLAGLPGSAESRGPISATCPGPRSRRSQ